MTIKYTETTLEFGYKYIERIDENGIVSCIPIDPANSDYQAYLAHLTESVTPQAKLVAGTPLTEEEADTLVI